jgi:hypothetical protein
MIFGAHVIVYSSDAQADWTFVRDDPSVHRSLQVTIG